MKTLWREVCRKRLIFNLAFVAILSAAFAPSAVGQQPARPQGPPAAAPSTNPGATRIGVIYTEAFYEPGKGIVRLINAANGLEQEFQSRKTELENMQHRVEQLTGEVNANTQGSDPAALRTKSYQLDQLKRDFQHKAEEAQAAYKKRIGEVVDPIVDDISKAIDSFASERGIVMILDGSKLEEAILFAGAGADLTREFIADYNRRNPPAAVTAPRE